MIEKSAVVVRGEQSGSRSDATRLIEMWRRVGDRFGWAEPPQARIFELAAVGEL